MTTVTFIDFSVPCAASALSACTMMTAALHVDDAGAAGLRVAEALHLLERAVGFEHRVEMADEEDLGSRARVLRDQVPGALEGAPSIQRVLKPSASNSCRKILPTSCTPLKFWVPLLMLTTRSSSASARALSLSMKEVSAFSPVERLSDCVNAANARNAIRNLIGSHCMPRNSPVSSVIGPNVGWPSCPASTPTVLQAYASGCRGDRPTNDVGQARQVRETDREIDGTVASEPARSGSPRGKSTSAAREFSRCSVPRSVPSVSENGFDL